MATLFIAEDDPLMSRMYERAFRMGGHTLTMAGDGEEALDSLVKMDPKPSLILLDVMMPKMSGFDVLRKVKLDDKLKTIPVILLTNLAGEQDAEKGLQLGAVAYLIKSQYDPKQVVAKVEEIVKASTRGEGIPEVKVEVKDIPTAAPAAPATPPPPPAPTTPPTTPPTAPAPVPPPAPPAPAPTPPPPPQAPAPTPPPVAPQSPPPPTPPPAA